MLTYAIIGLAVILGTIPVIKIIKHTKSRKIDTGRIIALEAELGDDALKAREKADELLRVKKVRELAELYYLTGDRR